MSERLRAIVEALGVQPQQPETDEHPSARADWARLHRT
jgi:hypothetical protein